MRKVAVSLIGSALLLLVLQPATAGAATWRSRGAPACGEEWGVMVSPAPREGANCRA
jgi:hypothetical protein